ncbi:hypothetical protein CF319_g8215 [Tilletia indica]|nr:hypothetical protein CF319_g8215 [Tilletia indica]
MPTEVMYSWRSKRLLGAQIFPFRSNSGALITVIRTSANDSPKPRTFQSGSAVRPPAKQRRTTDEDEEASRWRKRAKLCPQTIAILSQADLKHPPKPSQIVAVDAIREGRDTVYVSPTASGKGEAFEHLVFLLPSGIIVVIEPLQALTSEMAERFKDLATYVDSTNKTEAHLKAIRDGKYRLVFTTAETATEGDFLNIVLRDDSFRKRAVAFVFDEAHTLDQWGRDFRPKFFLLGQVRRHLSVPALIMSATMTKEAREACQSALGLIKPVIVDVGTDRPNLYLRVLPMQYSAASFLDLLSVMPELWNDGGGVASVEERRRQFPVTLIYINNKDLATSMHRVIDEWFTRVGFEDAVDVYHADMSEEHLGIVRARLIQRKTLLAICTDAFGMGADCRPVVRVMQYKLFGGVSAWWQRMGRAGRDFADEAEAILFVESTHIDGEIKNVLASTGKLPSVEGLPTLSEDHATLEKDAEVMREGDKGSVSRKIVDDELLALAGHGLARDECIRRLVLDYLQQPKKETLPFDNELYSASRHVPESRRLPCCSTCDTKPLPTLPDHLKPPAPPVVPTLHGVMALQKTLQLRLEEWREEQWKVKWKATKRAGRMGVDAFMSMQGIDSVVSNLKTIANNIDQGNSHLGSFINTRFKSEVLGDLEGIVKKVLDEDREKREREKEESERARQQRAEEARRKREAERMERAERDRQQRVEQANQAQASGSTVTVSECTICKEINKKKGAGTVEGRGHRSDNKICPSKSWLQDRKPEDGADWPEAWMAALHFRANAKKQRKAPAKKK